ncbi:MAG: L-rhamnose isomerase [Sodalis sp. (in: enterobacteria)]
MNKPGNYSGKATNRHKLHIDPEQAFKFIPRLKQLNLHAICLEAEKLLKPNTIRLAYFLARRLEREYRNWD